MRFFYLTAGWISLGLGFAGVFLPLLPTTPFVLLALFCFSRGSPRLHAWVIHHPLFSRTIKDWQERGAIRLQPKLTATLLMVPLFATVVWSERLPQLGRIGLGALGIGVMAFLWSRPFK